MPYVNIRVAGKLTLQQKEEMSRNVTTAIANATGKPEESILIFIDELPQENIAKAGKLLHDK